MDALRSPESLHRRNMIASRRSQRPDESLQRKDPLSKPINLHREIHPLESILLDHKIHQHHTQRRSRQSRRTAGQMYGTRFTDIERTVAGRAGGIEPIERLIRTAVRDDQNRLHQRGEYIVAADAGRAPRIDQGDTAQMGINPPTALRSSRRRHQCPVTASSRSRIHRRCRDLNPPNQLLEDQYLNHARTEMRACGRHFHQSFVQPEQNKAVLEHVVRVLQIGHEQ